MKSKKLNTKFQNLKSEHGITLIALIITIIVMLILVAVTLSIALGENGVINSAKEAKEKTEIATEKEQLLDAVFATVGSSGEVDLGKIVLPEGFTEVSSDETNAIYQGPSGQQYEVENITGKITEVEEIEPEGDDGGENTNPVAGTYYFPGMQMSITLNEGGSGTFMGNDINYTYNDTMVTFSFGSVSQICNYYQLENNKILVIQNDGEHAQILAMNRNGIEGEEIDGIWYGNDSATSTLTIDSSTGTFDFNGDEGNYFLYDNVLFGISEGNTSYNFMIIDDDTISKAGVTFTRQ